MSPFALIFLTSALVTGEWLLVVGGLALLIRRADRL
jgi:hypothetical protein